MKQMEEKMEVNGYTAEKVYLDEVNEEYGDDAVDLARESIQESMFQGVSIVSYSGHGSSTQWSPKGLLKQSDIANIDNSTATPIALPFTCMVTYADSPLIKTVGQQLLTERDNGAVAVYGATTYSSYRNNGKMIGKVFEGLTRGETLGEAILNKKLELGTNYSDVIKNGNLLGDVTLRIE